MQKINSIKVDKLWGYEIWLHSPLIQAQTDIDGVVTTKGPLVKIIKADQPLSVQVHPNDILAKSLEQQENGKAECWYVLESNKETKFVVGMKSFDHDLIKESLKNKTFEELLISITPKKGDFINVPAGMVHGIGANSKVLEVQQPSDVTYRFYDYERLENGKPRDLHIEKSLKSLNDLDWKLSPNSTNPTSYKFMDYNIEIHDQPSTTNEQVIIVDFIEECAYIAKPNEEITFTDYAIISKNGGVYEN